MLEANAYESETVRPFALWIDALRKWSSGAASNVFQASNRDNREHLFDALSGLVGQVSADADLAVLFDDLQWCDESSASALHYVVRTNRERRLLVVLCARESELRDNAAAQQALRGLAREGLLEEIVLGPLPAVAIRALIESCAPKVDSGRLSEQCAGNPLLAIELARAEAAGEAGASLRELIRERLAHVDVDSAEVLRWASVLAPNIDLTGLVRATGMEADRVGFALERAERQTILLPSERGLRFSHDLVGRAVYAEISPARRRVMHRRVAELLEHDTAMDLERAADLAHHAAQSGDPDLACRATVCAGRLCLRFFANDNALGLAHRGLQLAERLPGAERVRLSIDLHDIILAAAPLEDWQLSAATYVQLAEQALDHGALAHARLGYHMASYVRWTHGHWSQAREETLQSERVTRGGSDREHILGMAETAKCLAMLERDLSQADALLMEAQALAAREGMSHHALCMAMGLLRFHENRLDEAEEALEEARTLCKAAGDRVSEFQAGESLTMISFERGDYAAARARCGALSLLGERLRDGSEAPFVRALSGLCGYALQDDPDALDSALGDLRAADAKFRLAYILTRAALLDVTRNRPDRALQRASEALDAATLLERPTEMVLAHVALAQAHRALGDSAETERHAAAVATLQAAPVARWAWVRAQNALAELA
jgi:predicted ATPase